VTHTIDATRALTIRLSTPADAPALSDLAQLDSAPPLSGTDVLVAEENGEVVAARRSDGSVIANPFRHTAATIAMLEARAYGLQPQPDRYAPGRGVFRLASAGRA
jgi:hypothetical protein